MSTITTRAGKGSPLTNNEVDANFTSLNTDKAELSGAAFTGAITTTSTVDGRDVATDGSKLDGIESGATADQTAAEIKTAYESNADTNAFTDADESKLDGIEAGADVTDTTNVTAAGALMDSELTSIASVKALDQGVATTDSPTFAGLTTSADVSFGDNDKAIFGAGSDLQLYHDGANSFITETGTGNLYITASDSMFFQSSDNTHRYAEFINGGGVKLRFDNSDKFQTTSTGIDVTGTATMDGLTVDGNVESLGTFILNNGTDKWQNLFSTNDLIIRNNHNTSWYNRLRISYDGDISFYEDTGTTAKLFWDASAESLGIGTSSPSKGLHLNFSNDLASVRFQNTANAKVWDLTPSIPNVANSGFSLHNVTDNTVPLHVDNSGNVGIGTSSIKSTLNLAANNSGQGAVLTLENTDTSITTNDVVGQIDFYANDGSTGGTGQKATIQAIAQNGSGTSVGLIFGTSSFPNTTATERLRISSTGAATFSSSVTATDLNITSNTPIIKFIESDQSNKQYQLGSYGSAFAIYDSNNSQFRYVLDTNGNHIFNEGGVDADFRVESDGNANMLFVDAGSETVCIGHNATTPTVPNIVFDARNMVQAGQSFFQGLVASTQNNNNGFISLFNLTTAAANTVGCVFDGTLIVHSYTGFSRVRFTASRYFTNSAIAFSVADTQDGTGSAGGVHLSLVTATVGSESFLGVQKTGGGTGTSYIDAFVSGIMEIKETTSGSYTVTATHGTLIT